MPDAPHPAAPAAASLGTVGRGAVAQCFEHVAMVHDVHWAAACVATAQDEMARQTACAERGPAQMCTAAPELVDDSPDCMLPPGRAAALDAVRTRAEQRCLRDAADLDRLSAQAQGRR
jgi:hypothetical protein